MEATYANGPVTEVRMLVIQSSNGRPPPDVFTTPERRFSCHEKQRAQKCNKGVFAEIEVGKDLFH